VLVNGRNYGCGPHRNGVEHACRNGLKVKSKLAEKRILGTLHDDLLSESAIEWAEEEAKCYIEELNAAANRNDSDVDALREEIANLEKRIGRVVDAISHGLEDSAKLVAELKNLEAEKSALEGQLAAKTVSAPARLPKLVADAMRRYRE